MSTAARTRLTSKLILLVGAVVLMAALAEGTFRLLAIAPPSVDLSSDRRPERAEEAGWNSLEFHDDEWTVARAPGTHRVAVLGDSFTAGVALRRDELFVQRVEASLNARASKGLRYELLNVSRASWDSRA